MPRETSQLTRTQLVGMIASLRGELSNLVRAYQIRTEKPELALGDDDIANAETLLHFTSIEAADSDLVEGGFDDSWHDDAPSPRLIAPTIRGYSIYASANFGGRSGAEAWLIEAMKKIAQAGHTVKGWLSSDEVHAAVYIPSAFFDRRGLLRMDPTQKHPPQSKPKPDKNA